MTTAQVSVDLIWLVVETSALIRRLAKSCTVWRRLSLRGSDGNFITALKAELMPHSFRPRPEDRFAKQTSGILRCRKMTEPA